jgi:hypothetical protein
MKKPITNMQKRLMMKLDKYLHTNDKKVAMYFAALSHASAGTGGWLDRTVREGELLVEVLKVLSGQIGVSRVTKHREQISFIYYPTAESRRGFDPEDTYKQCKEHGFDKHLGITGECLYQARFADVMEEEEN